MIHFVTAANRCLFEDELLEFRRIDCANSVHMAAGGPDALVDRADHFDDEDAIHILAIEDGRVCGAARLTPTSKPHRLGDLFPHLAAMVLMPIDASVLEATRAFYGIDEPVLMHQGSRASITREIRS